MNSNSFNPAQAAGEDWLTHTFKRIPEAKKATFPEEFENAVLVVDAAARLYKDKQPVSWEKEFDKIIIAEDTAYSLLGGARLKDGDHSAWIGSEMEIHLNCPEGMLGTLLVNFSDYNHMKRRGVLDFEGRKSKLGVHAGEEYWVNFHVMREDSNDGKLILKSKAESGGNLMINSIVVLKEN